MTNTHKDPLGLSEFPYQYTRLSKHCSAFIEPRGLANVGVIESKEGLILIDSSIHPYYMNEILRRLKTIFDKPFLYLINTHFHRDHTFGNQSINLEHGIVAHQLCADYFTGFSDQIAQEYSQFYNDVDLKLVRPSILFNTPRWTLQPFSVEVQLFLTGGHTHDSSFVWVPTDGVVFSGDVVFNRVPPYVGSLSCLDHFGRITEWISALQHIIDLQPAVIVPGHGVVARQQDATDLLRFFEYYAQKVINGVAQGLSITEIWHSIYRRQDFKRADVDVDLYLYITLSLYDELTGSAELFKKLRTPTPF